MTHVGKVDIRTAVVGKAHVVYVLYFRELAPLKFIISTTEALHCNIMGLPKLIISTAEK